MSKVRTIIIDGVEIQTSLSAVEIADLPRKNEELQKENEKYKEVIDKLKKHCEIEINASSHYLENHSSQQELCHKVAHQRILDILKEVE